MSEKKSDKDQYTNSYNLRNPQMNSQNQPTYPSNPMSQMSSNPSIAQQPQNPQYQQSQQMPNASHNSNVFFNHPNTENRSNANYGGENVNTHGGIKDMELDRIKDLIALGNQPMFARMDELINSFSRSNEALNERITANELKAEDREATVDNRFSALEEKLQLIERKIAQGIKARGGSEKILWLRGYPIDQNGNPISMSPYRNILPASFFEWVQGVTKVGKDSFKLRIKEGVECSYYRLGVLLAKYDADFRKVMPQFDTRTKKEHEDGVVFKQNRYYREARGLNELEELAVDFNEVSADGNNTQQTNVNFV